MITLSGFTKNLNRASRQIKALLKFVGLLLVITSFGYGLYQQISTETSLSFIDTSDSLSPQTPTPLATQSSRLNTLEEVQIHRIVDGDTVKLSDGRTVRYIGIDTPETVDPRKPVQCFGKEASEFNRTLVENKTVWLKKDVSETDRYGRLLRYLYLSPEASLSAQVNYQLVAHGYALASSFPPDVRWQAAFEEAQQTAKKFGVGLWSSDCFDSPAQK